MNTPSPQLYTNEVAPEFLRTLDDSPFTEQQLAEFSEEVINTPKDSDLLVVRDGVPMAEDFLPPVEG